MISNFTIAGWGSYRPRILLTSRSLDERQGHPPGWTERQFGIAARHVASGDETTSMMATEAAREAMNRAGWGNTPPDVIIGGCGVMEQPIPSTAALVQNRLGFSQSGVPSFDVNQTCLSFMVALDIAAMGIACGRWRRALVFASDIGITVASLKCCFCIGTGRWCGPGVPCPFIAMRDRALIRV